MTLTAIARGLFYPELYDSPNNTSTNPTLDAAAEKFAMIGRVYFAGRPAAAKTMSTGTIQFRTGACTFANGSTTLDIGIQDVATGAGPIAQPDGTFDVKTTLTGGAGITALAWNTATMTTGTKSITHGDLIAVVWDMTARAGADSVIVATQQAPASPSGGGNLPTTNANVAAAWQTTFTLGAGGWPDVVIVTNDGTVGTLFPTLPFSVFSSEAYADATDPDERGLMFQVPWDCTVDSLWGYIGVASATSDYTLKLYSDPTGTPSLLASVAVIAEQMGAVNSRSPVHHFITAVNLSKNTNYAVTALATGLGNVQLQTITLGDTGHRALYPGGTTLSKVTRNGSAGAFTAENPAITLYKMGVTISHLHDTSGAGSGVIGG